MKHLYLEDVGIVLANCFRKWCLIGLEKVLAAAKKELSMAMCHCWGLSSHGSVAETTILLVKYAGINKNCISLTRC